MRTKKPAINPTNLPAVKAISILEKLIADAEHLYPLNAFDEKREEWRNVGKNALVRVFGAGDPNYENFQRAQCIAISTRTTDAQMKEIVNGTLRGMVAALKGAVIQLQWDAPGADQQFFAAGSEHDAFIEIRKIIAQRCGNILIADPYVDDSLWALLKNASSGAKIQVLTSNMKCDFKAEAKTFAKQHGNQVEIRTTQKIHDRFIVVDGRCWQLGASIKDAGGKACMLSEITEPLALKDAVDELTQTWAVAPVVPL